MDVGHLGSERKRQMDRMARPRKCQAPWGGCWDTPAGQSQVLEGALPEPSSRSLTWEKCSLPRGKRHDDEDLSRSPHCTEKTHDLQERFRAGREMEDGRLLMHQRAWLCIFLWCHSCLEQSPTTRHSLSFFKGEQLSLAHLCHMGISTEVLPGLVHACGGLQLYLMASGEFKISCHGSF